MADEKRDEDKNIWEQVDFKWPEITSHPRGLALSVNKVDESECYYNFPTAPSVVGIATDKRTYQYCLSHVMTFGNALSVLPAQCLAEMIARSLLHWFGITSRLYIDDFIQFCVIIL